MVTITMGACHVPPLTVGTPLAVSWTLSCALFHKKHIAAALLLQYDLAMCIHHYFIRKVNLCEVWPATGEKLLEII